MADLGRNSTTGELRAHYGKLVENMVALNDAVDEKLKVLEEKQLHHDNTMLEISKSKSALDEKHAHYDALLEKITKDKAMLEESKSHHEALLLRIRSDKAQLEDTQSEHDALLAQIRKERSLLAMVPAPAPENGSKFKANRDVLLRMEGTQMHGPLCGAMFLNEEPEIGIMKTFRNNEGYDSLSSSRRARFAEMDYYDRFKTVPRAMLTFDGMLRWDPNRSSHFLRITDNGRTILNTGAKWGIAVGDALDASFMVRINVMNLGFRIGYAKENMVRISGGSYDLDKNGWFMNSEGRLFSAGDANRAYTDPILIDDVVTVLWDRASGQISFEVNGRPCGVAFRHLDSRSGLLPCVGLFNGGGVSLEN